MTETWSSKLGFILAAIGATVGLGTIWASPSAIGHHGGILFLLLYMISMVLIALPLLVLEISIGQKTRRSIVSVFEQKKKSFEVLGWFIIVILGVILSYTLVIAGSSLGFVAIEFFSVDISAINYGAPWLYLPPFFLIALFVATAITGALTGFIVYLGVNKGIERVSTVLIPLFFLILGGLFFHATNLPGFERAASFLFEINYNLEIFLNPIVWIGALGYALFSLSAGYGLMIVYGGYKQKDRGILSAALIVGVVNLLATLASGLVIFSFLVTVGGKPDEGVTMIFGGLHRAFISLPSGHIIGALFYLMSFIAALTSSVALMEVIVSSLSEKTNLNRKKSALWTTISVIGIATVSILSHTPLSLSFGGPPLVEHFDKTVGVVGWITSALLLSIIFVWKDDIRKSFDSVSPHIRNGIRLSTKYLLPILAIVLISLQVFGIPHVTMGVLQSRVPESTLEQLLHFLPVIILVLIATWGIYRKTTTTTPTTDDEQPKP